MDLSQPSWLWLLIPWLLTLARAIRGRRRREAHWKALGQGGRPPGDGALGGMIAALLLIIALTQPRWGRDPESALPPGRDVVLLVDVSRSMGAEDAVPSRLGVAIESARGLIEAMAREEGDRVAVVAFAGAGVVRCGLTENLGAAREVVRRLRVGTVQPGGTDLGGRTGSGARGVRRSRPGGGADGRHLHRRRGPSRLLARPGRAAPRRGGHRQRRGHRRPGEGAAGAGGRGGDGDVVSADSRSYRNGRTRRSTPWPGPRAGWSCRSDWRRPT